MNVKILSEEDWKIDKRPIFEIKGFTIQDLYEIGGFMESMVVSVEDEDLLFDTTILYIDKKTISYKSRFKYNDNIILSILDLVTSSDLPIFSITENKVSIDYILGEQDFIQMNKFIRKSATFSSTVQELSRLTNIDEGYIRLTLNHREDDIPYSNIDIGKFVNYFDDISPEAFQVGMAYSFVRSDKITLLRIRDRIIWSKILLLNNLYFITRFYTVNNSDKVELTLFEDCGILNRFKLRNSRIFNLLNSKRSLLMKTVYDYLYGSYIRSKLNNN